jgi:hypothetical protein
MNGNSNGPHILLFERDQQLTTLLAGELALAGYEVHTARTAVEVFDAIARFPVRLVMVDLAQAQAGRREFWVALDTQRRGRGVQVFTFRCTNLAGYGPEDPDERVQNVQADLDVDGMNGVVRLVNAVRSRVPVPGMEQSASAPRQTQAPAPPMSTANIPGRFKEPDDSWPMDMATTPRPTPNFARSMLNGQAAASSQRMPEAPPPPSQPARSPEPQRAAPLTFTDKIRAVIYPSSRNFSPLPETNWPSPGTQAQNAPQNQHAGAPTRAQGSQHFTEDVSLLNNSYEETSYRQAERPPASEYNGPMPSPGPRYADEESSLDQLSRLLRESQPSAKYAAMNGNMQNSAPQTASTLNIAPQEIQEFRSQMAQAARLDEASKRPLSTQTRPIEVPDLGTQLRASPIQDIPFERDAEVRRGTSNGSVQERPLRAALSRAQSMQTAAPIQPAPEEILLNDEEPFIVGSSSGIRPLSPLREVSPVQSLASTTAPSQERPVQAQSTRPGMQERHDSNGLDLENRDTFAEQMRVGLAQSIINRPDFRTTDDTLLDIVKSLPLMTPAPQPPQVLSGRATRSLGSVLLEGHLVPQERLQVAQHVQRMLRGVDLNYQLGEILLMFKLLTPDQLLAASLLSYGMISTIQISALGRIRQELHSMGLEYDLESLLVLFRILTPEQLREVRASWSS